MTSDSLLNIEKFHWQIAHVQRIVQETTRVKTITLQLSGWIPHLPGQHYDIRLTAEDGYQAQRSYSIASPPEQAGQIELTIELTEGGEVSEYLHNVLAAGDSLEVRGPIGGYFVWKDAMQHLPLLLVAGGSGIVPLMAILRHRVMIGAINPTALLFSVKAGGKVIYQQELMRLANADNNFNLLLTYTRQPPSNWLGYHRRIDRAMLNEVLPSLKSQPICFLCGPTSLVENVANILVEIGLPPDTINSYRTVWLFRVVNCRNKKEKNFDALATIKYQTFFLLSGRYFS